MYLSEFAAHELMTKGDSANVVREDSRIRPPGASGTPGRTYLSSRGQTPGYTVVAPPHIVPGLGDYGAGQDPTIANLIAAVNQLHNQVGALVQENGYLKNMMAQTMQAAKTAENNVLSFAANVEANFAAVDRQTRGLADSIVALDRNMVETFSPRRVGTPGAGFIPKIYGGGKVSTAQGRTIDADPRITKGTPKTVINDFDWSADTEY